MCFRPLQDAVPQTAPEVAGPNHLHAVETLYLHVVCPCMLVHHYGVVLLEDRGFDLASKGGSIMKCDRLLKLVYVPRARMGPSYRLAGDGEVLGPCGEALKDARAPVLGTSHLALAAPT